MSNSNPLHIVYAVTDCCTQKVRVSRPMSWGEAIDRHTALDHKHRQDDRRKAQVGRGFGRDGEQPVRFYAVRSANDPNWPATHDRAITRDTATGRFI